MNARIALEQAFVKVERGTGEELVDVSDRGKVRPWAKKKVDSMKVAELYKLAMDRGEELLTQSRYQSLLQCGNSLLFGEQNGKKRLLPNKVVSDVQLAKIVEDVQSGESDQRGTTERKIGNKVFVLDVDSEKRDRNAIERNNRRNE